MHEGMMTCTGFFNLATSATPAALLAHIPLNANGDPAARAILIRATGNNANYTLDGTTPTVSAGGGMPLNTADTAPVWIGNLANLQRFQAVATTGSGGISVLFFN